MMRFLRPIRPGPIRKRQSSPASCRPSEDCRRPPAVRRRSRNAPRPSPGSIAAARRPRLLQVTSIGRQTDRSPRIAWTPIWADGRIGPEYRTAAHFTALSWRDARQHPLFWAGCRRRGAGRLGSMCRAEPGRQHPLPRHPPGSLMAPRWQHRCRHPVDARMIRRTPSLPSVIRDHAIRGIRDRSI